MGVQLRVGRRRLAESARRLGGVAPVAVGGPVVDAPTGPLVPSERFAAIRRTYAGIAAESLMCALQVHVEVTSRAEGVAVIDRVRPWTPLILAMSANSPFWQGKDTGFASWRSQVWKLWPSTGPIEVLGDVAAYDELARRMLETGAVSDVALLNLDVRLSARYPTVEWRVADACTDVDDTMVVAALVRGLTETAAREARRGVAPADWRVDQLRVAAWRAARYGLEGDLLHPGSGLPVPAKAALEALRDHVADSLAESGDLALVDAGLGRLLEQGGGAARQRRVFAVRGSLDDVVDDLRRRTGEEPAP